MPNRIIVSEWEKLEAFPLPIVYCPNCGGGLLGQSSHRIDEQGNVSNSVICPCGFHEWIKLENYDQGVLENFPNGK